MKYFSASTRWFSYLLCLCKGRWQACRTRILAQRILECAASDLQHLDLVVKVTQLRPWCKKFEMIMRQSIVSLRWRSKAYLHIQTRTPAGQRPGPRSSSAGPSASCRKGWPTQSGTQGLAPDPGCPAASAGRTPSGGAALWGKRLQVNIILMRNSFFIRTKKVLSEKTQMIEK